MPGLAMSLAEDMIDTRETTRVTSLNDCTFISPGVIYR